jgi:hypothetical protein
MMKVVAELAISFISLEELVLLTKFAHCQNEEGLAKIRLIKHYVNAVVYNESVSVSYTNGARHILRLICDGSVKPSRSVYKGSLSISHIREIVGMFKVCCTALSNGSVACLLCSDQNVFHTNLDLSSCLLQFTKHDWDSCLVVVDRYISELESGIGSKLDILLMWLTAFIFRGDREKGLQRALCVVNILLEQVQENRLFGNDSLISKKFCVSGSSDVITWKLHVMAAILQLLSVVCVFGVS